MNHTTSPTLAQALAQAHTLGLARIDAQLLLLHAVGCAMLAELAGVVAAIVVCYRFFG